MSKTVYLHIGYGRCGSTAIQRFAEANRAALAERGISYPSGVEMGYPEELDRGGNAQAIYQSRESGEAAFEGLHTYLGGLESESLLLSSEYLAASEPEFLRGMVEAIRSQGMRALGIAYVRDQREWLISAYAQGLKSRRLSMPLEEHLRESYEVPELDYLHRFEALAEVFGREDLVVRIFEPGRLERGDVRADLFSVAGIEVGDLLDAGPPENPSASVEEVEVLRLLNELSSPGELNPRAFLRSSQRLFNERGWKPNQDLYRLAAPEVLREIADHYRAGNEAFREAFFPGEEPPLFDSKVPDDYVPLEGDVEIAQRSLTLLANHFLRTTRRLAKKSRSGAKAKREQAPRKPRGNSRVAICAIAKNEGPYLHEWAAYHRLIGFEDILVYDHESTDESGEVLATLEREGLVESIPWSVPPKRKPQWLAYEDGLERLRDRADWIAFIDLDEFIVLPQHETIQAFLAEYGSLDAIAMNWKMFGTSGHETREPGLVIERFTQCSERDFYGNQAVKTLARPEAILVPRVHKCKFREGVRYQTVTGDDASSGTTEGVSHDVIRVNHYFTRSREEWAEKVARGRGAKAPDNPKKHRTEEDFRRSNRNEAEETDILRHVPAVKALIESAVVRDGRG